MKDKGSISEMYILEFWNHLHDDGHGQGAGMRWGGKRI